MSTSIITPNWRQKLYKDISTYMIMFGVFAPELINFVLENWSLVAGALGSSELNDGYKSGVRLGFLLAAFAAKFIKQYKTPEELLAEKVRELQAVVQPGQDHETKS